ncbi:MAG: alpha/beta hydrolase [Ruminococcus sp.]|uniref:alpha/beta hydrolase n=1 Tax=Ruminococcus sp. TaxID=41978 RepID=UPI002872D714|nr:alpha/beta hydrolase [Ruminococcus sp.]MBQ3284293.1 alpha/beta hydrolase [Ruminococcus sp.]
MVAFLIVTGVILLILAGLFAAYHKTFYSPTKDMSETKSPPYIKKLAYGYKIDSRVEELSSLPCEFYAIRSYDGLKLSARYYEGDSDKPLCICFHGYRGSAVRDFSGVGLHLIHEGYNVLIVDERAHWRSQGHTICFGVKERYDVVSWVKFARKRYGKGKSIFLFGISMGGGTVLMASGQQLPSNVKGIIADCPFNSPKTIIKHVCRMIKLNPELCWPAVWLSALIYGRLRVNATTAAREVKKTRTPIVIIHGESDDFVPMSMSKEVQKSNPSMIEMHTFPNAGHGLCYFEDEERYIGIVDDFIEKHRS